MSYWSDMRKPLFWVPLLIGFLVSAYFWWASLEHPGITYRVSTVTVFDKSTSGDSIKVADKSGTILTDSVFVSEIVVWNSGDAAIEPDTIRRPLTLTVTNMKRLLDYQLVSETHDRISEFKLVQPPASNDIQIGWTHFDPGEGCKIRLIYTSSGEPSLAVSGVVFGVSEFREQSPKEQSSRYGVLIGALIGVVGLSFMIRDIGRGFFGLSKRRARIVVGTIIVVLCFLLLSALLIVFYSLYDIFFSGLSMPEL